MNEAADSSDAESARPDDTADAGSSVAAAETAASEAAARAREARARAERLQRRTNTGPDGAAGSSGSSRWRRRLPGSRQLLAGVGVVLVCASSAASGSMWWQHRIAAGRQHFAAELAGTARQISIALLTLDYTKTEEHIQRILDNSTGDFKSRFEKNSAGVGARLGQAKVVATVDVKDAAVRSMSDKTGVVLVAAQTTTTSMEGAPLPESWRMELSLAREGGRLKLADVEFVE